MGEIFQTKDMYRNAQRWSYACLAAQGSRTPPRGTLAQLRYRDLPEKQTTTKEQQSTQGKMQCSITCMHDMFNLCKPLLETFTNHIRASTNFP